MMEHDGTYAEPQRTHPAENGFSPSLQAERSVCRHMRTLLCLVVAGPAALKKFIARDGKAAILPHLHTLHKAPFAQLRASKSI